MRQFATILLIFLLTETFAQKEIKTFEVSDTIAYATVDRPGDLYLITISGQIQKYDKDGKLKVVYKHKVVPTIFEGRDGARLFAYYRHDQQYDYLSPSFEPVSSYKIDPAFAIDPYLICTSGEHKLWVLDEADHSLKKVNVQKGEVEVEVLIDSTIIQNANAFTTMREYYGFVFLLNPEKGIHIFNGMGRLIKTIDVKGVHSFNFLGEELYYVQGSKLKFVDLFNADSREMDLLRPAKITLLTDERMFSIQDKVVKISEYRP
jgi:hypothetical protein